MGIVVEDSRDIGPTNLHVADFGQNGIQVVVGATAGAPEAIVRDFLDGRLATGANVCDH